MKVYVLIDHLEYDGPANVWGVFSTKEKAMAALAKIATDEDDAERHYAIDCVETDSESIINEWLEHLKSAEECRRTLDEKIREQF